MIRGTTAAFKFKLPYTKDELTWATIKFWQTNNPSELLPIYKRLEHCNTDKPNELCVSLTAEETARFSEKFKAKAQLRALHTSSGTVFGCKPRLIPVYPMSDDILDDDPIMPGENEDGWIILDGENIMGGEE